MKKRGIIALMVIALAAILFLLFGRVDKNHKIVAECQKNDKYRDVCLMVSKIGSPAIYQTYTLKTTGLQKNVNAKNLIYDLAFWLSIAFVITLGGVGISRIVEKKIK